MKTALFLWLMLVLPLLQYAQSFTNNTSGAIIDFTTLNRTITVSGLPTAANCTFGLTRVCLNISHDYDADLDITLTSPTGQVIVLSDDNGGAGKNYVNTCFTMTAATSIVSGTAPFTGTFRPEGNMGIFNTGGNPNGNWILSVYDDALLSGGTFNNVTLTFAANPSCVPLSQQDCFGGITLCNNASFTGNAAGIGYYSDLVSANRGCLATNEHQSSWYFFSPATSGTFELTIMTAVDYDFAIWGPMATITCPPPGPPLRCSYASSNGNTGMSFSLSGGDDSEGTSGNRYVNGINATTGQKYIMVIDNFNSNSTPFTFSWTITNSGSLSCVVLPVEFILFEAETELTHDQLHWATASEINASHFEVGYSTDGINFIHLGEVSAAGNSSTRKDYFFKHDSPRDGIGYYRLLQYDNDGEIPVEKVLSVHREVADHFSVYPNPSAGHFTVHTKMKPADKGRLVLVDLTGKIIQERFTSYSESLHYFDCSDIKGTYILEYNVNGTTLGYERLIIE